VKKGTGKLQGIVVPHSATILEDEAKKRPSPMNKVLKKLGRQLARKKIDVVLAISPFWLPPHSFCVDASPQHKSSGDYQGYAVEVKYDCPGEPALARLLLEAGKEAGLPVRTHHHGADHSLCVPMPYLFPRQNVPVVPLSSTELSLEYCLKWGQTIRETVKRSGKNILLLSGGGLSHNLTACLHWEDSIAALIYDQKILNCLQNGNGTDVVKMDPYWFEVGNPTAKVRDLFVFLGAIGKKSKGKLLAYDGAPGVGWAAMEFKD